MARYRKVDVRIWNDRKFNELSSPPPNAQTLWFYLLTTPSTTNIPGLFSDTPEGMAARLRWPVKGLLEAFGELFAKGMAKADWKAGLVWVPGAIKYNKPENPNVVKSWQVPWDELPECDLKDEAYQHIESFLKGYGEGYAKAFGERCRKGMANQEQEQEQDQEHTEARAAAAVAIGTHSGALSPPRALLNAFADIAVPMAAAGKGEVGTLAAGAVAAYASIRKGMPTPPGWNAEAVGRHSADIQRVMGGEKPVDYHGRSGKPTEAPRPRIVAAPSAFETAEMIKRVKGGG